MRSHKVFLLDGHEVVRRGVRGMLATASDIVVVGEAATAAEALRAMPDLKPDVVVLDVKLPDSDGAAVCREIRRTLPDAHCLMLTSFADDQSLFEAIMAGAAGYVLKQIRADDLVNAIRRVASGQSMIDAGVTERVMRRLRSEDADDPLATLTDQERRILELVGEGLTNRQIGERLFLAEKTVKNYVSTLLSKLGMQRRTQLAVIASKSRQGGPPATAG